MNVAICGLGTIGSGVLELIDNNNYGLKVTKIFDKESKKNLIGSRFEGLIDNILNDNDIDVVCETMGGLDFAYNVIKQALQNGKHVVTANKEVCSIYLKELIEIAKENKVMFLFEASVGGGIPIIKNVCNAVRYDIIENIYGIINGTSNYVLTEMTHNHKTLEEAIISAQKIGYAELDPTNDLEGLDMVRKIAILTMLANDMEVPLKVIQSKGIKNITSEFILRMSAFEKSIKLMASSIFKNGEFSICVEPVIISNKSLIANVNGAYNAIFLDCKHNGRLMYNGLGAGKLATACALVNDMLDIIKDNNYICFNGLTKGKFTQDEIIDCYVIDEEKNILLKKDILRSEAMKYPFYARIL